ncbi:hypothetical protein VE03_06952 [Pseudogymnoascus sp. 23342-1-I1]|nr:hypothetical protein VE03_06952 [Pseudogymnoascus sp. 23342-1-I1]
MASEAELVELAHPEYWDERYSSGKAIEQGSTQEVLGSFEWFGDFAKLRPFFVKHLPASSFGSHILQLGCGNSTMTADIYNLGYKNQTSIDFSRVVIDAMESKYSSLETRWRVMDVRQLELPDGSVDVAIDKGTLDAMIHGSLWDPPDDVRSNVGRYVDEVARVLKPGGEWLYITYRQPHFMKPLLGREDSWDLSVEVLAEDAGAFEYFGYIMRKHQSASSSHVTAPIIGKDEAILHMESSPKV